MPEINDSTFNLNPQNPNPAPAPLPSSAPGNGNPPEPIGMPTQPQVQQTPPAAPEAPIMQPTPPTMEAAPETKETAVEEHQDTSALDQALEKELNQAVTETENQPSKLKKYLIFGVSVIVILALAGLAYYFFFASGESNEPANTDTPPQIENPFDSAENTTETPSTDEENADEQVGEIIDLVEESDPPALEMTPAPAETPKPETTPDSDLIPDKLLR